MAEPAVEKVALDNKFLDLISKSVGETFSSFFGIQPVLKQTILDDKTNYAVDLTGVIAFIQNALEGTMAIRFKKEDLFKIIEPIYEEKLTNIDSRALGCVGEFANIIHGVAKQHLNAEGYNYQMCLPVVIVGTNHRICSTFEGRRVTLIFDLNGAEAILELNFAG